MMPAVAHTTPTCTALATIILCEPVWSTRPSSWPHRSPHCALWLAFIFFCWSAGRLSFVKPFFSSFISFHFFASMAFNLTGECLKIFLVDLQHSSLIWFTAVEDSSPLISYAPSGAWTDSPDGDSLIQVSQIILTDQDRRTDSDWNIVVLRQLLAFDIRAGRDGDYKLQWWREFTSGSFRMI